MLESRKTRKAWTKVRLRGRPHHNARKYALNGLYAIDDNKDADTDETQTTTRQTRLRNNQGKSNSKNNKNKGLRNKNYMS